MHFHSSRGNTFYLGAPLSIHPPPFHHVLASLPVASSCAHSFPTMYVVQTHQGISLLTSSQNDLFGSRDYRILAMTSHHLSSLTRWLWWYKFSVHCITYSTALYGRLFKLVSKRNPSPYAIILVISPEPHLPVDTNLFLGKT
jgi:hypothetical protein